MNKLTSSFLLNPFERIAGAKALLWGLLFFVASILLGYAGRLMFDGLIDIHIHDNIGVWQAFLYPTISMLVFIVLLYLLGRWLGKSSVRFIDVLGTVFFARTPYLLVSIVALLPPVVPAIDEVIFSTLLKQTSSVSAMAWVWFILFLIVSFIAVAWFVIWAYKGFSVSCNVKGSKAIAVFAIILFVVEALSLVLYLFI